MMMKKKKTTSGSNSTNCLDQSPRNSMSDHLPLDVLFEVLARIPVKSLLRFRCVSKSWADLIDSPEFIKIQLDRSLMDPRFQKVILSGLKRVSVSEDSDGRGPHKLFCWDFNSPDNFNSPAEELYYPNLCYPETDYELGQGKRKRKRLVGSPKGLPDRFTGRRLVGSCNGLLCIRYKTGDVVLYNPWTRKHKRLHRSSCVGCVGEYRRIKYIAYGFGYDHLSDDYKVVKVVGIQKSGSRQLYNKVKVYSLKSDSWKSIENIPQPINTRISYGYGLHVGVHVNCALHWLTDSDSILAIDLRTNENRLLSLPNAPNGRRSKCRLGVSDGCLSMSICKAGFHVEIEIWLMKVYGIQTSWTKVIVHIENVNLPLLFLGYSESEKYLIYLEGLNRRLEWYDIENKQLHEIEPYLIECLDYFVPGLYYSVPGLYYSVPSLVPIS